MASHPKGTYRRQLPRWLAAAAVALSLAGCAAQI
ncbi:MAG: hypothetical protein JWQ80_571, partial [Massilia sp.]|nr:hypothetical protein [Massilia sp.]